MFSWMKISSPFSARWRFLKTSRYIFEIQDLKIAGGHPRVYPPAKHQNDGDGEMDDKVEPTQ